MARKSQASGGRSLSWSGFGLRLIAALLLVFATYNPDGYSYYHWVTKNPDGFGALQALAGVILVIGWAVYIRATLRSLGMIGLILAVAFFGTLLWLLIEKEIVAVDSVRVLTYIVEAMVGAVMGVGMSWSFVRRQLTGQLDVDDVD